jgi:hypothetical protein
MLPLLVLVLHATPAPADAGIGPVLARTLIALAEDDQADRRALSQQLTARDRIRAEELKAIVDRYAWPPLSLVGERASRSAWMIAQHADHDVAFQRRCLELLERAIAAHEADPGDAAYLVDRIRVNEGRPQVYGTQFGHPIEDPAHVDTRRKEAGLEPLADYLAHRPAPRIDGGR